MESLRRSRETLDPHERICNRLSWLTMLIMNGAFRASKNPPVSTFKNVQAENHNSVDLSELFPFRGVYWIVVFVWVVYNDASGVSVHELLRVSEQNQQNVQHVNWSFLCNCMVHAH